MKEKNTKEKILEEALKLFAQCGYMGTSMNDIASQIGVTKAALYKHYSSKQEILDSIVEKMNQMDLQRSKEYEMPEGDMDNVIEGYKTIALEKIKQYTKVQFLHWTEEEFSSNFRKMLTLEQYRSPEMSKLYQHYLAEGPLQYMETIFSGIVENREDAKQLAIDFYGPIFLLYSIYDISENKQEVVKQLDTHVERFSKQYF
ncbi:TetR/AcrR family transcriptional regulator [uncultured Catenibacterium sp.]|uniref:TetR/AcrR family transcriptional regulator n=1 Tax=uncultured Catenibacterium sp. TaxID=286142 RepID=UPI0025CE9F96|nr:TetR/AcrR family transcriptional regulator [uncultured Catenibacterium sp.]